MERKYLLVGRFTSICSTTRNHYRLFKCNRDYLTVDVIIFSKKKVMIIKANLIEAGNTCILEEKAIR